MKDMIKEKQRDANWLIDLMSIFEKINLISINKIFVLKLIDLYKY